MSIANATLDIEVVNRTCKSLEEKVNDMQRISVEIKGHLDDAAQVTNLSPLKDLGDKIEPLVDQTKALADAVESYTRSSKDYIQKAHDLDDVRFSIT
jgi:hypothetical protein